MRIIFFPCLIAIMKTDQNPPQKHLWSKETSLDFDSFLKAMNWKEKF